ncbi:hypothetical protein [Nocardia otitidiscaviarum]|uniref:hypothetical protein n=1 Tax=Nocardia otitidiscaviarum TaxID=1823 RepID=UPI0024589436|nr:hypothetical protein [Nocardia otitidiscaviarum]
MAERSNSESTLRVLLMTMGLITATPAIALVDAYALEWTYRVTDPDPMTLALLQHRGMLQLLLGAALVWAAFHPPARFAAAIAAIVGKSTFLLLILPNPTIRGDLAPFSIVFDLLCIAALTGVAIRYARPRRTIGALA